MIGIRKYTCRGPPINSLSQPLSPATASNSKWNSKHLRTESQCASESCVLCTGLWRKSKGRVYLRVIHFRSEEYRTDPQQAVLRSVRKIAYSDYKLRHLCLSRPVFLNRRAAARYRALTSITPGRERFYWNLSF